MPRSIGANVAKYRELAGLSDRQLARRADLADQTVIDIENGTGNPTIKTLEKIANVLGVEIVQIVATEEAS